MPLENFYKSSDDFAERQQTRTVLLSIGLIALAIVGYVVFADLLEKQRNAESSAARVADIEAACSQLPTPDNFVLDGKTEPVEYQNGTLVTYRFRADQPAKDSLPTLARLFEKDEWQAPTGNSTVFYKNGLQISIKYEENEPNIYEIDCFDRKIDFGIYD